jgi:hypothetical protein
MCGRRTEETCTQLGRRTTAEVRLLVEQKVLGQKHMTGELEPCTTMRLSMLDGKAKSRRTV